MDEDLKQELKKLREELAEVKDAAKSAEEYGRIQTVGCCVPILIATGTVTMGIIIF